MALPEQVNSTGNSRSGVHSPGLASDASSTSTHSLCGWVSRSHFQAEQESLSRQAVLRLGEQYETEPNQQSSWTRGSDPQPACRACWATESQEKVRALGELHPASGQRHMKSDQKNGLNCKVRGQALC